MTDLQQLTPLFVLPSNPDQLTHQKQAKSNFYHQKPYFHNEYRDLAAPLGVMDGSMYQPSLREVTDEQVQAHYRSKLTLFDILCQENNQIKSWPTKKIEMDAQEIRIQNKMKENHPKIQKMQEKPKLKFFIPQPESSSQSSSDMDLEESYQQEKNPQKNEKGTDYVIKKMAKRKRNDDSNNAHKKIITCLNKSCRIVEHSKVNLNSFKMKKLSNQHSKLLKSLKSSRYGFITQLIYLQYMYGQPYLQALFSVFSKQVLPSFIKQNKNIGEPTSREYLLKLPAFYIESFQRFMKGQIEQATELIYKMDMKDRFKQALYLKKGIEKVIKIRNELLSLA